MQRSLFALHDRARPLQVDMSVVQLNLVDVIRRVAGALPGRVGRAQHNARHAAHALPAVVAVEVA